MHKHVRCLVSLLFVCFLCGPPVVAAWAQSDDDVAALVQAISSNDAAKRIAAIDRVTELGARARAAVPALTKAVRLADDAETRWRAARALAAIGPPARPAVGTLIKVLEDSDPMVRAYAAHAIGKIGPGEDEKKETIAALVQRAVDKSNLVRREVREALLAIGAPSEITIPLLVRVLQESEPQAVGLALETLAQAGKKALPSLCQALGHDKACYWACLVIEQIGPEAESAVPQLMHCIRRDEPEVRIEALLALAAIGKAARPATEQVIEILASDPQIGVRYAAAYALGKLGDPRAVPVLRKAAESNDAFLRLAALWSLVHLQPDNRELMKQAVQAFADGLRSKDKRLRAAAANALAETDIPADLANTPLLNNLIDELDQETIGMVMTALVRRGKSVVPRVVRSLNDPKRRIYALRVLGRLGPQAAEAAEAVQQVLESATDAETQREAIYALGNIGKASAKAVPLLIKFLNGSSDELRNAAIFALGGIGPDADEATAELLDLVESASGFTKQAAVWALVRIHPDNDKITQYALDHLIAALGDQRPQVRALMAAALGDIGPAAQKALPQLRKLATSDPDPHVRDVATAALVKIADPKHSADHPTKE